MIHYECKDGSHTVAKTAPLALVYWLMRHTPRNGEKIIYENEIGVKAFTSDVNVPGPTSPKLVPLTIAAIERKWGVTPCEAKGVPGTDEYEENCKELLNWLREHGDITDLRWYDA